MKKLLLILLGVLLALPGIARDFTYEYEGQTLTYTVIDEDAKTCQTKEGSSRFDYNNGQTYYYAGNEVEGSLKIPTTVSDGSDEFTVVSIGAYAFTKCYGLTSVDIPNSVESIGIDAFYDCSGLTEVTIPNSVNTIGDGAFYNCTGLNSATIGNSVNTIGNRTFYNCTSMKTFTIEEGTETIAIEDQYIKYAPIEILNIGRNWTYSGSESAFSTSITAVNIGNKVTELPPYAFAGYTGLSEVSIPISVTSIGKYAFKECSNLTSLIIPNSVQTIGTCAFYHCDNLTKAAYPDNLKNPFESIEDWMNNNVISVRIAYPAEDAVIENGFIYGSEKQSLLFVPVDIEGEFTVPESVITIGNGAFAWCGNLTSVVIPESVKSIEASAFDRCKKVSSIVINGLPPKVTDTSFGVSNACNLTVPVSCYYSYLNDAIWTRFNISTPNGTVKYYNETDTGLRYAYSTEDKTATVISWSGDSEKLIMPRRFVVEVEGTPVFFDVIGIRDYAFVGKSFSEIELPKKLQFIGNNAFLSCQKLKNIVLPDNVKSIGDYAFALCPLESISFNEGLETIGNGAFTNDLSRTRLVFFKTDGKWPYIHYWQSGNSNVTTKWPGVAMKHLSGNIYYYIIPETLNGKSLEKVGVVFNLGSNQNQTKNIVPKFGCLYTLEDQTGEKYDQPKNCLAELKFPSSLHALSEYAFAGSENLESIEFKEGLSTIGNYAFSDCRNLKSIEFKEGLSAIGNYAFSDCGNLENIVLPEGLNSIGDFAFNNCNRLGGEILFQEGLNTIGESAFAGSQFTSVSFPSTLKAIKKKAFSGNTALSSIQFAETQDLVIGESAFSSEGNNLTSLNFVEGVVEIENEAFKGSHIVDLKIPSSLKTVGDNVFSGNNISELSIPSTIESFGNISVADRINVEDGDNTVYLASLRANEIYIGRNFEASGTSSSTKFNAKQLSFGNIVTILPSGRISGSDLTELNLNEGLKEIGEGNFRECKNLTKVVIPPSVETIGSNAFFSGSLETVAIGCGIKTIGDEAFANNENLNTIEITAINPPAANNNVFSYYNGTLYTVPESADIYVDYPSCWYRFDNQVSKLAVATEVAVDRNSITDAKPGERYQLSAEVRPAEALQYIFWKSTNPTIAKVDYKGLVTIMDPAGNEVETDEACEIHAYSLYDGSPIAVCTINVYNSGVEDVIVDGENSSVNPNDVYNMQGVCIKRNATQEDINALAPGLYIIGGKKMIVR